MFNVMEDLYDFFSSSTKRHEVLSKYMVDVANALKLRNLSKTRWTARAKSIQAVWISYEAIVEALEEILTKPVDAKTRAHASGLQAAGLHCFHHHHVHEERNVENF